MKNNIIQWFCGVLGGFAGSDPKVMATIETSSLRWFIWYLAKSKQTYSYEDINYQGNYGAAAAVAAVQYVSKVLIVSFYLLAFNYIFFSILKFRKIKKMLSCVWI